jgi:hypothetical protein
MIHPQFAAIPDRDAAAALSEAMVPGAYKFLFPVTGGYPPEVGYPPEPAYLSTITAAYLSRNGQSVKTFTMHGYSGRGYQANYRDVVKSYEARVGAYQQAISNHDLPPQLFGLERTDKRFGVLGQWAIEAAQADDNRLIAAHWISVTRTGKKAIDALIYPVRFVEEVPLLARHALEPLAFAIKQGVTTVAGHEIDDSTIAFVDALMQQERGTDIVTGLAVGNILPPVAHFRQNARAYYKKQ